MLIAIEAERANIENPTGVEHYARQLILSLAKIDKKNNYVLYLRTNPQDWILNLPQNFSYKVMPFPIFWTQLRISWEVLIAKPDALFIPASALPFIHPKNSVVTIHDLAWLYYPQAFSRFMRFYLPLSTWYACHYAKKIIAVSNQTKADLLKSYGFSDKKVEVIYHGFDINSEIEVNDEKELQKISALPDKFILYLGTLQPRKNIIGLIDAFTASKKEKKIDCALVIAGGKGWLYEQIMEKIKSHPDIIYFGYVKQRFALLRKAAALVQPAFYEGFGLQVLDAFACDVPVACSNVSSLPEVAGDAAEYFDPKDINSIQNALDKIVNDQSLRQALIAKGKYQLQKFSWEKCARQTLEVISQSNV